jgi:glycosyltransferase involved in cell wall biosynthesis
MNDHTTIDNRLEQNRQDISISEAPYTANFSEADNNAGSVSEHERGSSILLAISVQPTDIILAEIAAGKQPRRDFMALRQALGADIIYPDDTQVTLLGRIARRFFGARIAVAWDAFRRHRAYDYVLSDTEKVGLPLAMLMKLSRTPPGHPRHIMIAQNLSPLKKRFFFRLGVRSHLDIISVHSSAQHALATEILGMPKERVMKLPMFAETQFWQPPTHSITDEDMHTNSPQRPIIFSAGLELRDYPTLFKAVRNLDLDVYVAAASAPAFHRDAADRRKGRKGNVQFTEVPANVFVKSCNFIEMRRLYAAARFVVVPVVETDDSAGLTVILEAMAMGKAVIVSGTRGQTDVIRDPRNNGRGLVQRELWPGFLDDPDVAESLGRLPTGFYTTPGDSDELRDMIQYLLDHPEVAEELGRNGRRVAEEYFSLEAFVQRYAAILGKAQLL